MVSIARIERPQLYRGGSASTETMPAVSSLPFQARLFLLLGTALMIGSTAAVERGPSEGARSGSKEPTWVPFLSSPLCLRRRPIQFGMAAAVEAGEAVAGFAPRIWHGGKGDGGVVEGASGLLAEEMHFGHHGDRGAVPGWGGLFFAGNLLLRMTLFAFGFVSLDTGEMEGVVGDVHRSAASRLGTGEMFVL